jgi:hypothetical protein
MIINNNFKKWGYCCYWLAGSGTGEIKNIT